MILQTLYQNCVRHNVEFYNEFYVLDLIMSEDENGNPDLQVLSPMTWQPAKYTFSNRNP